MIKLRIFSNLFSTGTAALWEEDWADCPGEEFKWEVGVFGLDCSGILLTFLFESTFDYILVGEFL